MRERQLHLFNPHKPLVERLGEDFFRAVPRVPGVYIMTDVGERVLYVGQSGNLRSRLASYKNAKPDRASRKVIRLVHAVERITWEACESAEGARLRENELLRLYRPKFNRLNVWPAAYRYLRLCPDETGFEIGLTRKPRATEQTYGAFKGGAIPAYAALLRLTWALLHQPASPHDFPPRLFNTHPPPSYRIDWNSVQTQPALATFLDTLASFLSGTSDSLLQLLDCVQPDQQAVSAFQRALWTHDLEALAHFYRVGPQRLRELSRQHKRSSLLVAQDELDDLLV